MPRKKKKAVTPLQILKELYDAREWLSKQLDNALDKRPLIAGELAKLIGALNEIDNRIMIIEMREQLFCYDFKDRISQLISEEPFEIDEERRKELQIQLKKMSRF